MLDGFEDITFELTDQEKDIAGALAEMFSKAIGVEKAIKNSEVRKLFFSSGLKLSGPRVRKMIQYIRTNELCPKLVASSKGYYVAKNEVELKVYIESLRSRIRSMQFTLVCLTNQKLTR